MANKPVRIRLSRKRGFNLQEHSREVNGLDAVNVSRPSKFGNPFTMAGCRDAGFRGDDAAIAARCVESFRVWIDSPRWRNNWDGAESEAARTALLKGLTSLRGKNLACWCALDAPCHADVLLDLANEPIKDQGETE